MKTVKTTCDGVEKMLEVARIVGRWIVVRMRIWFVFLCRHSVIYVLPLDRAFQLNISMLFSLKEELILPKSDITP